RDFARNPMGRASICAERRYSTAHLDDQTTRLAPSSAQILDPSRPRTKRQQTLSPDQAKSEVEAWRHRLGGFRHLMLPIMLGCASNDQQRAMSKLQGMLDALMPLAAQIETPGTAKIERSHQWVMAQLRLIVTVPAHGVLAIAVIVEQHTVQ